MSESVFRQIAATVLRLHRKNTFSWLALGDSCHQNVANRPYTNINGKYYFWFTDADNRCHADKHAAVMLIEDEIDNTCISWVGTTRVVTQREQIFQAACESICRRACLCNKQQGCLIELTPAQGQLSIGNTQKLSISPQHLKRALFPVQDRMTLWAA